MFLGIAQVLGRQLFDRPISGYIDFVELSMASFAFLGIAYCQAHGGHVRMDMLVRLAKGRTQWMMELFGTLLAMVVIAILIWYGYDHFTRAYELGDSTIDAELPVWPSKLVVPVAFALLWLRLLIQLIAYLRLVRWPQAQPVAVPLPPSVEDLARREIEDSEAKRG